MSLTALSSLITWHSSTHPVPSKVMSQQILSFSSGRFLLLADVAGVNDDTMDVFLKQFPCETSPGKAWVRCVLSTLDLDRAFPVLDVNCMKMDRVMPDSARLLWTNLGWTRPGSDLGV